MGTLKLKTNYLITLMTLLAISVNATAGLRCKSGLLVSKGDTKFEVINKCGSPTHKEYFGQVEVEEKLVNLERWVYVPRKGKLVKYLDLHNGVVNEISTGSRVK
jgi:hypothetical protein